MKLCIINTFRVLVISPFILSMGCQKNLRDQGRLNGPSTSSNIVVTKEYWVSPSTTDSLITTFNSQHFVSMQTGAALKNILFVNLPGTNRIPSQCKVIAQKAVTMGYHAISLTYSNATGGNPLCGPTGDTTCHLRLRREVIDGVDRHPSIVVTPANSIINRLTKLLIFMKNAQPTQGWGQYLVNNEIDWSKVIISGHSQGGALAGVIGRFYPVKRVIMFSIVDFLNNGKIPDWEKLPANNANYYSLINLNDELVPWYRVKSVWNAAGWMVYGNYLSVDWNLPPYNNTHLLISTLKPTSTSLDPYHNMTGVDSYFPKLSTGKYAYEKAWEYLLK
ncbi:MAG TPA: hypothetical protein VM101_16195 [Flavitalea sp.]|nr:hypothetical protein [Flavitalea sp.]